MSNYTIKMAGQDITLRVDQQSIDITDTLGQGSGAGNGSATQGRASTFKFNTNIGPMTNALGAGQSIPGTGGPYLVRQGEVTIFDQFNNQVFGGFTTKLTDISDYTTVFTAVEGVDYSTSLQRVIVNEDFAAATDIAIILQTMRTYVPWVKLDYVASLGPSYTFPIKNFKNVSVEQVLQTVSGVTGFQVWVDYQKYLHYVSPALAYTAPFNVSTQPDFISTYPYAVTEYSTDDNAAINRVFFYGGKKQSTDFVQDVSPLANGNNKTFNFGFYPRPDSTGKIRVSVNGTFQVVGDQNSTGTANTFISAGGVAQALINGDAKVAIFDIAPPTGATVLLYYRYEAPLVTIITDAKSYAFFGPPYLDGVMSDDTIFDVQTAISRSRVLLAQQNFGLTMLKFTCYAPGLQAGQLIRATHSIRNIHATFVIQEVHTTWMAAGIAGGGGGQFKYEVTCGAWNWNIIDVLLALSKSPFDSNTTESSITVTALQGVFNVGQTFTWTKALRTQGGYFARSTAVGDGHDAYPGFSSITS